MITFFIFACLFSAGFLAGSSFKHARFNQIPWEDNRCVMSIDVLMYSA